MAQPRIGKQIKHFEEVDRDEIIPDFSPEEPPRYRYLLSMDYKDDEESRTKTAVVILQNPSSTDSQYADSTIIRVEKKFLDASMT